MRIIYVKLTGYIGIYNGLGKTELEINLAKCKNHITVISGPNGCGKSTLLNALNILPDGNECFIPSVSASKQLKILDDNTIYDILILHPIDNKNNRATTKAYIKKNGLELNPNGNVSSYKDIVFNEFDLDNNFIALSHLSSDDRGLADKKPAERKRFVASISNSLEVYNSINKTLNKKSNYYKSYLNSLSGKIKMIGDENNLRMSISSLDKQYEKLQSQIDQLKKEIIQDQTIISLSDPNNTLRNQYTELENQTNQLEKDTNQAFQNLKNYYEFHFDIKKLDLKQDKIQKELDDNIQQLSQHNSELQQDQSEYQIILNNIQNIQSNIDRLTIKINKLQSEVDSELDAKLKDAEQKLNEINTRFHLIGIQDIDLVTKFDLDQAVALIDNFIKSIDMFYEIIPDYTLKDFISVYQSTNSISNLINDNNKAIDIDKDAINHCENELSKYLSDLDNLQTLEKRPELCKISNCFFLSKPVEILKKYNGSINDLNTTIKYIKKQCDLVKTMIDNYQKELERLNDKNDLYRKLYQPGETILHKLTMQLESNNAILNKIGILTQYINNDQILDRISNGDRFNDLRNNSSIQFARNDIIEYQSIEKIYQDLLVEQKINKNNLNNINEYQKELDSENEKIQKEITHRNQLSKDIQFVQSIIANLTIKNQNLIELQRLYNQWVDKDNQYQLTKSKFEDIQKQFKGSSVILSNISEKESRVKELESQINPIKDQKKTVDSQLMLLDSYQREFNDINQKYIVINTLRKYSSPTSGGIQTLFMNLYMSKTLNLANQLLSMLFQGQYQLLDYVINADEFRMPFIGSGLTVDDVSNGSCSQVAMLGMVINLVLLHQASTKYNITRLDEIDSGLDSYNRGAFVDVLQQMIQLLGIDQLFIISHSCESALGRNVDSIILAPISDFEDMLNGTNIVYTYKEN